MTYGVRSFSHIGIEQLPHDQHGFQNVQLLSIEMMILIWGGTKTSLICMGLSLFLISLADKSNFLCFSSQTVRKQTPSVGGSCAKHCRPEAPRRGQHGG